MNTSLLLLMRKWESCDQVFGPTPSRFWNVTKDLLSLSFILERASLYPPALREGGPVEHIAVAVSQAMFLHEPIRLAAHDIRFIEGDRGVVDSFIATHRLRLARNDHHIDESHVADAIIQLMDGRDRL